MNEYSHEEYDFINRVMELSSIDSSIIDAHIRSEVTKFVRSLFFEVLHRVSVLMQHHHRTIPQVQDLEDVLTVFSSNLVLGYTSGFVQDISLRIRNDLNYAEDEDDNEEQDEDYDIDEDSTASTDDDDDEEVEDSENESVIEEVELIDDLEFENEDEEDIEEEDLTDESFIYFQEGSFLDLAKRYLNQICENQLQFELFGENYESKCVVELMSKLIIKEVILSAEGRMER